MIETEHYKQVLLAKQQELTSELARDEEEMQIGGKDVGDSIDAVTEASNAAALSYSASVESEELTEIQDALNRIEDGTYGKCVVCGHEIPKARLDAIPWARRCLEDEQKADSAAEVDGGY